MHQTPSFRMVPHAKQRIFVVKPNNVRSRFIQDPFHSKHDFYESVPLDPKRKRFDSFNSTINSEIDRLMNLPSNLILKSTDTADEREIKSVLNELVHKTAEADKSNQQTSTAPKKFCTFRPIEDKIQSHVERLRAEIHKRRHSIETQVANDLGLTSPWRRTRYHRKTPKFEDERHTALINPKSISLNFDDDQTGSQQIGHQQTTFEQYNAQQNFYSPNAQMQPQNMSGMQHFGSVTEQLNESEQSAAWTKSGDRCPVCSRDCRKNLFCLCCDQCGRRFHGKCVKMTVKRLTKRDTPWKCADCENTPLEPREDLFCVCKKPYDSKQFYVGCDICEGWFHPNCVGTTQKEIESIEGSSYVCPNCREISGTRR
ncbi:hypothetical protein M3Y97_00559400 [Aphelenchoides bicaudatus]|nr:hypothetical protein M3Y97_00559400 [Aphelenchoides bicaudatus]